MAKKYCENCRKGTHKKGISETFTTTSLVLFMGGAALGALLGISGGAGGAVVGAVLGTIILGVPAWLVWVCLWFLVSGHTEVCAECDTEYR